MPRTILVTGANSGLGFEAARQLAQRGDHVVVGARSRAKADDAVARLQQLTGRAAGAFGTALFDNHHPDTIRRAVAGLTTAGTVLDAVVLNAGGVATPTADGLAPRTDEGWSAMYAMNIHGHVVLVDELLAAGRLAPGATVMLAGTEASRGIGTMRIPAPTVPEGHGDLDETLRAVARGDTGQAPGYDPMQDYALVKLIGTVWMRQLAREHGLRALTVSPGFTGGTAAIQNLPAIQRFVFGWIAYPLLKLMGNAHPVDIGAARYLRALDDETLQAGGFYASPDGGISGEVVEQGSDRQPLLADAAFEAAVHRLIASHRAAPLRAVV